MDSQPFELTDEERQVIVDGLHEMKRHVEDRIDAMTNHSFFRDEAVKRAQMVRALIRRLQP